MSYVYDHANDFIDMSHVCVTFELRVIRSSLKKYFVLMTILVILYISI